MLIFKIGFLDVRLVDIIDILLVATLMYQMYKLLRGTLAFNIFIGFLAVALMYILVRAFDMNLLTNILGGFISVGVIALLILFQPEIRRFLLLIGRGSGIGSNKFWTNLFSGQQAGVESNSEQEELFLKSVTNLANNKVGALIVLTEGGNESFFANTGQVLNADFSGKLLESLFQKTGPLHDGAVVVSNGKIAHAGCVLPVSENPNLPSRHGMRHRAGVGITEQLDAQVLIVSEETGKISVAHKGELLENASPARIKEAFRFGMN